MVNCSFWLVIMTICNTTKKKKIGLMQGGKDDIQCVTVCQCSDCGVYYCCYVGAEPHLGHLGFLIHCSHLAAVFNLGH